MDNIKDQSKENNLETEEKNRRTECAENHEHCHHEHHHEHEHHHDHDDCVHEHTHHDHEDCDHDHHHHHEHEDCGHEHHHDHEHEHHHEHSHAHTYDVSGFLTVESHTHEGAAVCSFEKKSSFDYDEACEKMSAAISKLRDELNSEGHIIGHLKGFIKQSGEVATFSTVGADITVQKHPQAGAEISFAAIVFGPDEEALKDKLVNCFAAL